MFQPSASPHPYKCHLTAYQRSVLEDAQKLLPELTFEQRAELAKALDLEEEKVYRWFWTEKKKKLLGNETLAQGASVLQ